MSGEFVRNEKTGVKKLARTEALEVRSPKSETQSPKPTTHNHTNTQHNQSSYSIESLHNFVIWGILRYF